MMTVASIRRSLRARKAEILLSLDARPDWSWRRPQFRAEYARLMAELRSVVALFDQF